MTNKYMIEVKDLSYCYKHGEQDVLKKLTFAIEEGEIFGFLGPSGAGKSTTQKILYKILHGFSGEVLIAGKSLSGLGNDYLQSVGVGFELPNHYLKLTAKENMQLFASFYDKEKLLNLAALFKLVGLQDDMDKAVETFSKGMQMRLNFIRAIQHDPDVIFFDEPTAGLDPVNAHKIKQHILQLKQAGKTIFITTHDMVIADQLCDRVAFLVNGEIKCIDEPKKLKQKYGKNAVRVERVNGESQEFSLKNLGVNAEFLSYIKAQEIKRIESLEASLEEVFIQLTGHGLI